MKKYTEIYCKLDTNLFSVILFYSCRLTNIKKKKTRFKFDLKVLQYVCNVSHILVAPDACDMTMKEIYDSVRF